MARIVESHKHSRYPRLTLQLRDTSKYWQALTFIDGKKTQKSLKVTSLKAAYRVGLKQFS